MVCSDGVGGGALNLFFKFLIVYLATARRKIFRFRIEKREGGKKKSKESRETKGNRKREQRKQKAAVAVP